MTISTILLLAGIAAFFVWIIVWAIVFGGKLPVPIGLRRCQGKNWRRSFPDASKDEIRQFLSFFVESFAFRDREKLKLNPNDQILDIYRAQYPHKWQADALEFETLSKNLKSKYGADFNDVWRDDLTLGQLFAHVQQVRK